MNRFEFKTYNSIMELETQLAQAEENAVRWKNYAENLKKERDGWISEYNAARAEVERIKLDRDLFKTERDMWLNEVKRLTKILRRYDQEDDINDGKNSSHEHSEGKGGWSV